MTDMKRPKNLIKLGVGLVVLFGSRIKGKANPTSDLDIGIVFSKRPRIGAVKIYDGLYSYFLRLYPGRKLDIVYFDETPYKLQYRAMVDGKVLFSISNEFYADWKERVMKYYFDFSYVDRECEKAFLKEAA